MKVRLVQLDGNLPNLALMKLSHWHRSLGDEVYFNHSVYRGLFEPPAFDVVYGSAIFTKTLPVVDLFRREWPGAIIGGTALGAADRGTVEGFIGKEYEHYDYSGYPGYNASIGFTQRGCRLKCKFCVVPQKEGKPRSVNTIYDIWRGDPWPKKLHLLDNDFFGQDEWRLRLNEIRDGGFRVCLSQGINVRMITAESAEALASIEYRDTSFSERKLYTAWDNLGDEKIFFTGVDLLERAGIPSKHLMAYMLIGYDQKETWERIWYRFKKMVDRAIEPYAMVYDPTREDLVCFARWVNRGMYRIKGCSWPEYERSTKSDESVEAWNQVYACNLSPQGL